MITLILGGARSGKSALAERLAAAAAPPVSAAAAPPAVAETGAIVTYVATMRVDHDGYDAALAERIAAHRARRPAHWRTVEAGDDLAATLRPLAGTVLLDSIGPWVAAATDFRVDTEKLCSALAEHDGHIIVVSDEAGLGVHPATEAGGAFRDALGTVNQAIATVADRALLVVAGQVLTLAPPPER